MTEFLEKLANKIIKSEGYAQASNLLFSSYVHSLTDAREKLERSEVKKLISAAQALSMSEDKNLKNEGAILLSMLLDICADDYPDIVPIAHSMFVNSGDFPNIELLHERHPELDFKYNFFSEAQMEFRLTLNTVPELNFPLTDFQRSLWDDLSSDKDVITAAPTSAGKTHIILNYLLNKVVKSEGSFAAVIVPTRALISEVTGKMYELAKDLNLENEIEICTVPKEGDFRAKTFFVMTQERLHEVLQRGDIYFDYLFIDEAQNIATDSRGVLLHMTIEKMLDDSFPQVIISMPSSSYQNSFSTVFKDVEFEKEITQHSPVAKVVMAVMPKGQELVISRNNSSNVKHIKKGFTGKNLADIVYKLGRGESNIIYRNKTNECENLADKIASLVTKTVENPSLEEAAEYIEEFIHAQFTLADNLRKGVAFHYGPLPSSVRVMIENLVKDDEIKFIACTSTLAEGVNLPAKNLFMKNPIQIIPYQPSEPLEDVKINNIIGRAGRMLSHFSGNIFLIEPEDWNFKDYFDDEHDNENKIPTYYKALNEKFGSIIDALRGGYAHDEKDQYTFYMIANKLIKELASDKLENTLRAEELILNDDERELLYESIKSAHETLQVAAFTLEANPTVGYIQQNKLFAFLNEQKNYEEWLLPHPKSPSLYESLLRICDKLNDFGIYIPTENYTTGYTCIITRKWIQGNSLKEIISEQIKWDIDNAMEESRKPSTVNVSVRKVITVINNDVRFRLSNALRCYQMLLNNVLIKKELDLKCVKIHAFIEVGACEERMINLINLGLSREAAKEIHDELPDNVTINTSNELLRLNNTGRLKGIHAITRKELIELIT